MRSYDQYCGLARALDHIGHRWTLLIVRDLLLGPRRFTDLREGLPGIANNLLADRLRHLQDDGLVTRRDLPPPAASTVYELTESGRQLREVVHALIRWGGRWMTAGHQNDEFRPEWLVLALDALSAGRIEPNTVVEFNVNGAAVYLTTVDGQLTLAHGPQQQPDLRVTADASTILGLAAGELTVPQARPALELEPDTPEAIETLARFFSRAPDAPTELRSPPH
ncbi:MAG: winged helix-turn-helix transcriptional regulator [Actinomycetota bacterium]|nr:winged helix-turn-helix transcriptional regulator [Actinomycetota bacterium]